MNEVIESVDGVDMYRITDLTSLEPFLMTIVSSSDLWMFVSSSGGVTAGRVSPEDCIFPYETDDRLHRSGRDIGPATVLRITSPTGDTIWEPFRDGSGMTRLRLSKSLTGDAVVFEAEHPEIGLRFRYRWAPSSRFGWVRTSTLSRLGGDSPITVQVTDGLTEVMPWGISVAMQQQMSNLANAYRRSELIDGRLGVYALEAAIVDRPEPAETLRATTVWSTGPGAAAITLDGGSVARARHGRSTEPSSLRVGRPGSFIGQASIELAPDDELRWHIVADVAQRHTDITDLRSMLHSGDDLGRLVDEDIRRSSEELRRIVATADGLQVTASPVTDAHHFANSLFNVMRGGTFLRGHQVPVDGFRDFVRARNRAVFDRHVDWLAGLDDPLGVEELTTVAAGRSDPDLERLAFEYLPLSFSRRHGDPSRPWNHFAIRVQDDHGEPVLSYQGNWRDIFQNWEALGRSFPDFLPSMIAKFVNASTADGYNPYRITSDGIDWEIVEPDNPWSGIGYWGDHQIVYLDRLLRQQRAHDPDWIGSAIRGPVHSFANVPYRLAPFDRLILNPKSTLTYDEQADAEIRQRVAEIGADGRLLLDGDGNVVHVTLLEKLLIPALAKLSNYVPRGGIWMNTQRPEWNDANNALVGHGLSMVTLAHLRRYLALLGDLDSDGIPVSEDVTGWLASVTTTLRDALDLIGTADEIEASERGRIVHDLGSAYGDYRSKLNERRRAAPTPLAADAVQGLVAAGLAHLDDAIRTARRDDGLYHAYNVMHLSDDGRSIDVAHLPAMLEGQVAVIGSGLLDAGDVVGLVDAMYESDLYRPDVDSFMLYPATPRPSFLDRNRVPADDVEDNPLLTALVASGSDVLVRGATGTFHFNADLQNADDLRAMLDEHRSGESGELVERHGADVLHLFERVFRHHEFTGRSSTMHAYEGLGSVYWHMVAKLLVAIQESILDAPSTTNESLIRDLVDRYRRVRLGLGVNKTAGEYGAFPTDPYSHTPCHAGAQQPGMTGQVKEELLTRWAELGLVVADGTIRFVPTLFDRNELRVTPGRSTLLDVEQRPIEIDVEAGEALLTVCQVPVVIRAAEDEPGIRVTFTDGSGRAIDGLELDAASSRAIFGRAGRIARLDVTLPVRLGDESS